MWQAFGESARQTFFYSATWPLAVQGIAADLLSSTAVKVTVGKGGDRFTASTSVTQRVWVVADARGRMEKFTELMMPFRKGGADHGKRVIIFANMKVTVKKLASWCLSQVLGRVVVLECVAVLGCGTRA